jgi:hypothetical protein
MKFCSIALEVLLLWHSLFPSSINHTCLTTCATIIGLGIPDREMV